MKKLKTVFAIVILLGLLPGLTGCAVSKVILHPISQNDIILLDKDEEFKAPKSGAFLSDFYIEEVMKSKVED